ncbi:MAG: hypothetical protein K2X27_27500 [Candidatus Obscuribacterales bacterium]|nr:hypothetical protein [Candidatus Obscuribacterales bacterium]
MGGEIFDTKKAEAPADDSHLRPNPFGDLLGGPGKVNPGGDNSPGKINPGGDSSPGKINPGGDAPGKINSGGADTPQDKLDRAVAVDASTKAASGGDAAGLQKQLQSAFEKMGGDPNKFQRFAEDLATKLKDEGITVKAGKGSVAFHKDGSADAVEFKMDGNLDPTTGKIKGEAKAQSYDWVTKQDTSKDANAVIKDFGKKESSADGKLRDSRELGKSFDESFAKNDFSQFNKDIAASFAQAYKVGGMEAVRKLERDANDPGKGGAATEGAGPIAIEENGNLKIYNGEGLSKDAKELAKALTPEQLKAAGIVKHPDFGFLKIKDQGPPPIELKALTSTRN